MITKKHRKALQERMGTLVVWVVSKDTCTLVRLMAIGGDWAMVALHLLPNDRPFTVKLDALKLDIPKELK